MGTVELTRQQNVFFHVPSPLLANASQLFQPLGSSMFAPMKAN